MFNETVYGPYYDQLDGVASDAINALKNTPSQTDSGRSVWQSILGLGLSTGGAIVTALANRNAPQATLPYAPANLPGSSPYYNQQAELQAAREELAARQEQPSGSSSASLAWTKGGLQIGGGATLSPMMLGLIGVGLYLLFKEPPRRGR